MSALAKQAVHAFNREKPRSSITEWIEILTSHKYEDEAYDGIPELVDSINLQTGGTAEASRAIRKQLKHGDPHHQLRALVILKALVENCGTNFQTSFANDRLTDAIRNLCSDSSTDAGVKKKLLFVLVSWKHQFQGDPKMALVASLYDQCRPGQRNSFDSGPTPEELERRREKEASKKMKEEAKLRAKQEKREERERREREARRQKRKDFNFEQEKPHVLGSIAEATQVSSNLVNAIMLVNKDHEPVEANVRVQECLAKAKMARKQVVRYIQLVEDEEIIGTLLESNERIIAALEMYDKHCIPDATSADVESQLSRTSLQDGITTPISELNKLQEKQRATVARSLQRSGSASAANVHPDLHDLDFGALGSEAAGLQAPMRPMAPDSPLDDDHGHGSLSDFSDYDSSDEGGTHKRVVIKGSPSRVVSERGKAAAAAAATTYNNRSFNDEDFTGEEAVNRQALLLDDSDPFADPSDVPAPAAAVRKRTAVEW